MIGSKLGPYEIVKPLGAGGMGEVYLGQDTRLGRQVAIKVLPASFAADPERLARFEQEARAAAALNHPHIAVIHDVGHETDADGLTTHFMVQELLDGKDLDTLMRSGPLPRQRALTLAAEIAEALAAAHASGIVHRDLKPQNVFVSPAGHAKVLDFGLAKLMGPAAAGPGPSSVADSPTMLGTMAGVVMGSAGYMAPEQAAGGEVDHRADLFACGCVLYEMLVGGRAFDGNTLIDTLHAIAHDEPEALSVADSRIDAGTRWVLEKCLSKEPATRYQSAADLAVDLRRLAAGDGPETAAAAPSETPSEAPAVGVGWMALAGLLLASAVVGYLGAGLGGGADSGAASAVPRSHTQLTFRDGAEAFPSISADGDWIVYASRADGDWDIYLQAVGGDNAINLTEDSPADDWMPAMSPDGLQIVFRSERGDGGIYLMGRTGESLRRLTDAGYNPAWSPDGARVVVATESISDSPYRRFGTSELLLVDVSTGEITPLQTGDAVQPSFSPDGERLVFWGVRPDSGQRDLWTVRVDGGAPVSLLDDAPTDWTPVFTPAGDAVVFSSDRGGAPGLWRVPIDPASGAATGTPTPLVPGNSRWVAYPAFANNTGQLLYAAMELSLRTLRVTLDESLRRIADGPQRLRFGTRNVIFPDISPDGEWIAFSTGEGQQESLYLQRSDGSAARRLTNDTAKNRVPRFSPDGQALLFYSSRSGGYEVWTIDTDGSNLRSITEGVEGENWLGAVWSPDGDRIATTRNLYSEVVILTPGPEGTTLTPVELQGADGFAVDPTSWSPSGDRLAIMLRDAETAALAGILVHDLATGTSQRLSDTALSPVWLDADRHVAAIQQRGELWVFDTVTNDRWQVLSVYPDDILQGMVALRDATGVLISAASQEDDLWLAEWK